EGNIYKVERVNEWIGSMAGGGIYYSLHDAGDVNQNGIHELVVEIESGRSGIPIYEDKVLALYEWSSVFKRFEYIQRIPVFAQSSNEGPLEGEWSFTESGILITKENWYTGENCPQIAVEREYQWDGTKYIEMSTQIIPSAPKEPVFCRLSWADVVMNKTYLGWHNDEAIAVFDEFVNGWPDEFSQTMGPAILDYYKFKLGLWHDMRWEEEQALEILGGLAQVPTHPDFDLFSRLASLYLKERDIHGFAKACLVADSAYNDELTRLFPGNEDKEVSILLDKLGFITTDLAGWYGQLCKDTDVLPAAMWSDNPRDVNLVPDWLIDNGFTWYQKFDVDLNDDGLGDLLVSMDTYDENDPGIWLFFQSPNSVTALLPDRFGSYESLLVSGYAPSDFQMKLLTGSNWSYQYSWDVKYQHFCEADFFRDKQNELEIKIYRERDYETVIQDINEFFKQDIENSEAVKNCGAYCPEWYFPYFRHLLGFSYEMMGDTESAKSTYYSLWHDYPTNVFGIAASLKLEPVSP
ncbi:MAG TPA: hypothetical protein VLT51_14005, partial [Anaerolineales bacterium]|nr:hypothetical protein [Anaerolineales bacterium]